MFEIFLQSSCRVSTSARERASVFAGASSGGSFWASIDASAIAAAMREEGAEAEVAFWWMEVERETLHGNDRDGFVEYEGDGMG